MQRVTKRGGRNRQRITKRGLLFIVFVVLLFALLGPIANVEAANNNWELPYLPFLPSLPPAAWLSLSLVATSLLTFFSLLWQGAHDGYLDDGDVRISVGITIIVTYFVLLSWVAFMNGSANLPERTQLLLTSFTKVVYVVVPALAGASAIERVGERLAERNKPDKESEPTEAPAQRSPSS